MYFVTTREFDADNDKLYNRQKIHKVNSHCSSTNLILPRYIQKEKRNDYISLTEDTNYVVKEK